MHDEMASPHAKSMATTSSSSRLTVERLTSVVAYSEFLTRFLLPNVPCILPFQLVHQWPAFRDWAIAASAAESMDDNHDETSLHESFAKLAQYYGQHVVPVVIERRQAVDRKDGDGSAASGADRYEDTLVNAVALMREHKNAGSNVHVYVKDWHLVRQERLSQSDRHDPYETPSLFADDWMNNIRSNGDDDFRFCYAGMQGTRTKVHRDVYASYSWSTNVVGVKRWRLFPPSVKQHLRRFPRNPTSDLIDDVDRMQDLQHAGQLGHVKDGKLGWPDFSLAMRECYEVYQQAGETIFVPSDWHHEVVNLTDTISLNHNWCNATNIAGMYAAMCEEVSHVEEALSDVRKMLEDSSRGDGNACQSDNTNDWRYEWYAIVQRVAQANAGWAWHGFWTMIEHNLAHPSCAADLRPDQSFVQQQLQPCMTDFETRKEFAFLDDDVKQAFWRSRSLLNH